ncbi:MAG TPA: asparagine synthetase A [Candidatus Acidoferrum sp.]|nr:asparagine synthetase A [Candidatus Acidoferrum sp.]
MQKSRDGLLRGEHSSRQHSLAIAAPSRSLEELSDSEIRRKRCIGAIMTCTLKCLTQQFADDGFEWLLPVILSQTTDPLWPDSCASIEKRVEVEIYGKTVRTTTSMIVHKMVACSLAFPKLFILSPNVRIERSERGTTGMHAYEFTQLDFEVRTATSQNIRSLVEEVIQRLMDCLKRNLQDEPSFLREHDELKMPRIPFKVYDRVKLEEDYGERWDREILCEIQDPFWVTNIPREFYDFEDAESGKWDNYDLYLPGYGEVLSGARREFEYDKISLKMEKEGVRKENYRLLLKLAEEGRLKPSAGAGIGIERLVSWIVKAKHISETQVFPKIPGIVYDL